MNAYEALRGAQILSSFTDVGVKILSSIARERRVRPGEVIFSEGEPSDALYLLHRGEVEVEVTAADDEPRSLTTIGEGEVFGELSLLSGGLRMATVRATAECELLVIARSEFAALQKKKPQACLKLMMVIARHLGDRLAEDGPALRELLAASVD